MSAQTDPKMPSKDAMWDRVKRLGLLCDDGLLDLAHLEALADVPQCELESR